MNRKTLTILAHAFVGWALCGATMGIGLATTTQENALIIHAIGAPIFFAAVSLVYFSKYNYTSPLRTAVIFVSFVILVDFFLVALVINRSLEMFASPLGTWIPFALIFASTYVTGLVKTGSAQARPAA
jgi:hypothetical protein